MLLKLSCYMTSMFVSFIIMILKENWNYLFNKMFKHRNRKTIIIQNKLCNNQVYY